MARQLPSDNSTFSGRGRGAVPVFHGGSMTIVRRVFLFACMALLLGAPLAHAQTTTGSITGSVTDASGAVLPGVTITLSSDRLIGGPQTQISDTTGTYRFDRLVPGSYHVKFELQGFRTVERPDVRISA